MPPTAEISLVTFPANPNARISRVKMLLDAGQVPTRREVEAALKDMGFTCRDAKAFIAEGYRALDPDYAEELEIAEAIRELTRARDG